MIVGDGVRAQGGERGYLLLLVTALLLFSAATIGPDPRRIPTVLLDLS